ncbi:hypothetical protein CLCR_09251 [Cladophialophora carrionii]|uniref:Uncharacterized protein n=1 Tax=Cladophialophora carrionii TaxID=86049 RepID=A0A1C1CRT4_9EURO|nr:hypothetical protein CLCR_09251 [Cladophialophora carrionii]
MTLNAFVSRLFRADLITWIRFPIWTIRDSVELPDDPPPIDLKECRVRASAQWLENCSPMVLKTMRDTKPSESERRALCSLNFRGENSFSVLRWYWWKRRLMALALQDEFREEAIQAARRAVQAMDSAEEGLAPGTPEN